MTRRDGPSRRSQSDLLRERGPARQGPVLRVGNCSGFYGDRLSALREVVTGGPLDVVTGDYLAELTMLILGKDRMRDASLGYARTHLRQLEDCLGEVLERGVRVVTNAGGLNPAGLVDAIGEVARGLGLDPAVAWVDGDDLQPRAAELGWDAALTANAYLGGFGIARALDAGADVVVTGRVTDASLVVGAAAWHHGWTPGDHDAIAGAMVAGHVVECGTQATGGNFSGFLDLPRTDLPLGFPVAEVAADGSSVITKHDGTGGAVTVDTVTAQLLYEVQSTHYLGPDATLDLDSVRLTQEGPDRVAIAPVRGLAPPEQLKVCVNELGGWRNSVELVLTGLDVAEKAAWVQRQLAPRLRASSVTWSPVTPPVEDAATEEAASVLLRCTVKDAEQVPVDKAFTAAVVDLALGSYPGFTMTGPPGRATPYGVYRAAYVDRSVVTHTVHLPDRSAEVVPDPAVVEVRGAPAPSLGTPAPERDESGTSPGLEALAQGLGRLDQRVRRAPLGLVAHARSGDKGGDANIGVWARRPDAVDWLLATITPDAVRALLPEAADLDVEVHRLPHLGGVNVVLHGLLGDGVAAGTRFDPQAKGLGEWLRSRYVDVPEELL